MPARGPHFKTTILSGDQVAGFQMTGELLGPDGIGDAVHQCDAVALEDSQVCVIPFSKLEEVAHEFASLQRQFHRAMSREIVRGHDVMLLLTSMSADVRVAALVLNLSRRVEHHAWLRADWRVLSRLVRAVATGQSWVDVDVLRDGAEVFATLSRDQIALQESLIYPQARILMLEASRRETRRATALRPRAFRSA